MRHLVVLFVFLFVCVIGLQAAPIESTTTTLAVFDYPGGLGWPLKFRATVGSSTTVPAGAVTFYDGTSSLGALTLSGTGAATLVTSSLTKGTHSITAVYEGDATHAGSTSNALAVSVADEVPPPPPSPPAPPVPALDAKTLAALSLLLALLGVVSGRR